ncbi:MAG TPA: serine/threonine-protein kinase, partial [Gemmataceae bacterium]|nr:serine/threonine-protein kinase [Gemmataceae bacterium]
MSAPFSPESSANEAPAAPATPGTERVPGLEPDAGTENAPSFRRPAQPRQKPDVPAETPLSAGERLDDFLILRLLGSGGFARVYLARQLSLDRLVALKVSANWGHEGRTLATLEHDHIVQVFSETVLADRDLRLLCMQYVPGLTLHSVIAAQAERDPSTWSGRTILEILDALSTEWTALDPAALENRAILQSADYAEAVCWIGARLAGALAYAHRQGILHRDIKPANILLNRYGRPFLADFNIALDSGRTGENRDQQFGGTLAYMAPEHLEVFLDRDLKTPSAGKETSDVYALGVVLFELVTGQLPFQHLPDKANYYASLGVMAAERRAKAPSPSPICPRISEALNQVIRRCLAPRPEDRYPTAEALRYTLESCRDKVRMDKEMPAAGPLTRAILQYPFWMFVLLTLLPHFLGSLVNISYNSLWIVNDLTPAQQTCFTRLVLAYNAVMYPVCIWLLFYLVARVLRVWRRMPKEELTDDQVAQARRQALQLPLWAVVLSSAGWLPGGLLFPLGLHFWSDPVPLEKFGHFLISFTISGLIPLTYSYFAAQYIAVRCLYPRLWTASHSVRRQADSELAAVPGRLRLFQFLAGLIPLAGAMLMIS